MTNLVWFREEGILDAMLFKPLDDWHLLSPTQEEIVLLGEPQEAQAAAIWPPRCEEWVPDPKNITESMEAEAEPQATLVSPTTGIWTTAT